MRWRLRTLMIAVAIAGLVSAGAVLARRASEYREHVKFWRWCESESNECVRTGFRHLGKPTDDAVKLTREEIEEERADARHARVQAERYERVAAFPWLSLGPEPPDPPLRRPSGFESLPLR